MWPNSEDTRWPTQALRVAESWLWISASGPVENLKICQEMTFTLHYKTELVVVITYLSFVLANSAGVDFRKRFARGRKYPSLYSRWERAFQQVGSAQAFVALSGADSTAQPRGYHVFPIPADPNGAAGDGLDLVAPSSRCARFLTMS